MGIFANARSRFGLVPSGGQGELKLFLPVLAEQTLSTLVTMLGTIMVSGVGDFAVSGVGLVDNINYMAMNAFNAVAIGITVTIAQFMGRNDRESAGRASAQALTLAVLVALAVMTLLLVFGDSLLGVLFGRAERSVLAASHIFLIFSAISMPFLAIFSTSAGIMRATGNGRTPMLAAILMNAVYISAAAVLIYGFKLGVEGAGIALLTARVLSAVMIFLMLKKGRMDFHIPRLSLKLSKDVLSPVWKVALPTGLDTLIFNGGKILVQIFMSGMGTASLAAYTIAMSLANFQNLPGNTLSIVSMTVVGRAFGSGDMPATKRVMIRYTLYAMIATTVSSLLLLALAHPLLLAYAPPPEVYTIAYGLTVMMVIFEPLFWGTAFVTPFALRAVGDATYTMVISIASMFVVRVFGAWLLGEFFALGVVGILLSMVLDWVARSAFFVWRMMSGKWMRHSH